MSCRSLLVQLLACQRLQLAGFYLHHLLQSGMQSEAPAVLQQCSNGNVPPLAAMSCTTRVHTEPYSMCSCKPVFAVSLFEC